MQDSRLPSAKRAGEGPLEAGPVAPAERRRRRDLLNVQLRAIYDSYAASEIPPRLLNLASQFEEQARRHLQPDERATTRPAGQTVPRTDGGDDDA